MPITPWVPTVRTIRDGEEVSQSVVNVPLEQLIQREQHLYEKFEELLGKSVLIAFGQPVYPSELQGNKPLSPDELNIVYFREDSSGRGVCRALTGFSSSNTKGMYAPNKSNYSFGIVKAMSPGTSPLVDTYIEGLCELSIDLDDPDRGLIEVERNHLNEPVVEPFEVGPYYLSRKYPGKITKNPAGIPTYVGYAISKRKFLLHTSVDEFSQFFINYRYNVLDRPAATPELVTNLDGSKRWTIPTPNGNPNRLGWIEANSINLPGYSIAQNPVTQEPAKFFYYIPEGLLSETSLEFEALTESEKVEATELKGLLPPVPSNFVEIKSNGITQRLIDEYTPDGIYMIDNYGLWWFDDSEGFQPWADDILSNGTWTPDDWPEYKGSNFRRPRLFISFSKFNPALRTQLVSSLTPYNNADDPNVPEDQQNNSEPFIKFYLKETITSEDIRESTTGDLAVKVTPQFTKKGITGEFPPPPANQVDTYTSGRGVADIDYNQKEGKFVKVVTPIVAKINGQGGINVTPAQNQPGVFNISYMSTGIYGSIDSIEPINARLEFRGLSSYLKFPYAQTITVPYGVIGKLLLTKKALAAPANLKIYVQAFGTASYAPEATDKQIAFTFEYAATTAANSDAPEAVKLSNKSVLPAAVSSSLVLTTLTPIEEGYSAYDVVNLEGNLVIPASHIAEDTIVNFKLMRNLAETGNYLGDLGVLGLYWGIELT
jgi:hypothetical protein